MQKAIMNITGVLERVPVGTELLGEVLFKHDDTIVAKIPFSGIKTPGTLLARATGELKMEQKVFISTSNSWNQKILNEHGITYVKGHLNFFDAYELDSDKERIACKLKVGDSEEVKKIFSYSTGATKVIIEPSEVTRVITDDSTLVDGFKIITDEGTSTSTKWASTTISKERIEESEKEEVTVEPKIKYTNVQNLKKVKTILNDLLMKSIGLVGEINPAELNRIADNVCYMVNDDLPYWNYFHKITNIKDYITNTIRYAWAALGRTQTEFEEQRKHNIDPMFRTIEFKTILKYYKDLPSERGKNINRRQIFINGPAGSGKSYLEREWINNNFGIKVDSNGKDGDLVFVEDPKEFESGSVRHLVLGQDYLRFTMHPEVDTGTMDSFYTATDGFSPSAILTKLKGTEYTLKDGTSDIRKLRLLQLEEINHANPTVINWIGQLTDNSEQYSSMAVNDEHGNPFTVDLPKDFLVLTTGNCYDIAGNPIGTLPWYFISRSLYNLYIEQTDGLKEILSRVSNEATVSDEQYSDMLRTLTSMSPDKFIKK